MRVPSAANLAAAVGYYRAFGAAPAIADGSAAPQPTLYLHGAADGCISAGLARGAERFLSPASRMVVIQDAGHFPQLERPAEVNGHILAWVTG